MTDARDPLDDALAQAARDYNAPRGEVPRERMWDAIAARRAAARSTPAAMEHAAAATRAGWPRRAMLVAAVLVAGIAIGRLYERMQGGGAQPDTAARVAAAPPSVATPGATPGATPADSSGRAASPSSLDGAARAPATRGAVRRGAPESPATGAASAVAAAPRSPSDTPAPNDAAAMRYRLAVIDHLAGSEAMLVAFRASAARGTVDAEISTWARRLVAQTRLLAAAPGAARDPAMRRLLDDLELVLVQIANYAPGAPSDTTSLQIIEHSIERRNVLPQLRATVPPGYRAGA